MAWPSFPKSTCEQNQCPLELFSWNSPFYTNSKFELWKVIEHVPIGCVNGIKGYKFQLIKWRRDKLLPANIVILNNVNFRPLNPFEWQIYKIDFNYILIRSYLNYFIANLLNRKFETIKLRDPDPGYFGYIPSGKVFPSNIFLMIFPVAHHHIAKLFTWFLYRFWSKLETIESEVFFARTI